MPSLKVNSKLLIVNRKNRRSIHYLPFTIYRKAKGFTLIELLVVISIIAILISAATVSWTNAQQKGRDGRRKTDLKGVQQALDTYFQTNGQYPNTSSGQIRCNVGADTTVIAWGSTFSCNSVNYMQQLPKDPVYQSDTSKGYYYSASSPFLTYVLSAELENNNDPDRTGLPCTPQSPRDFCVIQP
ncbi:prepilin-type N-terminal cleavage/methylation domain-containing protein [Candidatus Curtissbacteria bacterium]|nr:prepilin-type N-terminal cleavage/methylation domain-containing protein [Candidatus Curtissbacteria bacterium]